VGNVYNKMACSCGCTGTNEDGNAYENMGYCFDQDWEAPCVNLYGDSSYKRKDTACPCDCTLIPCANVELCGVNQPAWLYGSVVGGSTSQYGNLCRHCDGMRYPNIRDYADLVQRHRESTQSWQRLEFKDATERCSVCFEQKDRAVKFPYCTHYFCIDCTWVVLHGHWESEYHLSPVPYGCPPCPNGCVNPVQGKQCYCLEYDNPDMDDAGVIQQWKTINPETYATYKEAETASIDAGKHPVYGSGKCPLCRSSLNPT
jgi:hypothetical protein